MSSKRYVLIGLSLALLLLLQGIGVNVSAAQSHHAKQGLIVVDPGYSGFSYRVANAIGNKLRERKMTVKIVKINAFKVTELAKIDLLVIGGPTYAHRPSKGVQRLLGRLHSPGMQTLLFQTGGINASGITPLQEAARMKGLHVVGLMTLTNKESRRMDNKIQAFLRTVE